MENDDNEFQPVHFFSTQGASNKVSAVTGKGKTFMAVRKIRQFEENFDPKEFGETAQDIYIKAHKAMAK